ncbi:acetoacetate decarboxylase family protein [Haloglomus litoreum]|uniref:acetoacetate decarboxylase family protein n=1 Tax=Haloglomus litoreum TaxID=3034026 RepID=UPI0023E8BDFF|nr:acetoacetate decarboxylase family protein [Haloglomus sp. DT116]
MTGLTPTHDEIERIQDRMATNRFDDIRAVSIRYLTQPSIVDRLLPPGLEPTDEPLVEAEVVTVGRSNCVGAFAGGGLYVRAQHDGEVGNYCLTMPMSTDEAVRWGRELLGEPKRQASVELERNGDEISGHITRHGEPLLGIEATMESRRGSSTGSQSVFHYKHLPAVTGRGFQFDPVLVRVRFASELDRVETGTGSIRLGRTPHAPLDRIEVANVRGASYYEGRLTSSQEELTTVDPDEFLPYALGGPGTYDWLALDNLSESSSSRP